MWRWMRRPGNEHRASEARVSAVAAAALVALSMARVASTWHELSETSDESAHVRSGLEWLDRGTYRFSPVDPPLSRLPVAVGPYLAGYRFAPPNVAPPRGRSVDDLDSDDPGPLSLARAGVLPMFAIAAAVVWLWGRRVAGPLVALLAVAIFALDPVVLAHTGVATTDVELTAVACATLLAFVTWWEAPSWRAALVGGALFGLALASKYAALALPACALAMASVLAWGGMRPRQSVRTLALHALGAGGVSVLVLWASYRFSVGTLTAASTRTRSVASPTAARLPCAGRSPRSPRTRCPHGLVSRAMGSRLGGASRAPLVPARRVEHARVPRVLPGRAAREDAAAEALARRRRGLAGAPCVAEGAGRACAGPGGCGRGARDGRVVRAHQHRRAARAAGVRADVSGGCERAGGAATRRDGLQREPGGRARVLAASLSAWLLFESHALAPGLPELLQRGGR